MTFNELLGEIQKVPHQEMRASEPDYLELVVAQNTLGAVTSVLGTYFGVPLKPAGVSSSKDADKHAEPYGGIQVNQTMYFRPGERGSELALLWPWGSGAATTVKIIRE